MLIVKKIFPSGKWLTRYIFISAVSSCDKPRHGSRIINILTEENDSDIKKKQPKQPSLEYPEKVVKPEEREKAKISLNALLESLSVEGDGQEKKEKNTNLGDMLKVQISRKQPKRQSPKKNLGELLFQAADTVAKDLGGEAKETKEDLLQRLKMIEVTEEKEVSEQLPQFPRGMSQFRIDPAYMSSALMEVLGSERLDVFKENKREESGAEVKLRIWEKLEEEELAYKARNPPRHQLEEWIQWTEQGKLWHFPIDNDQGMEREAEVDFTEHVFLEEHLEPWCPKKGPLKKFMELVLVGLSKNPYLTVEEKKEHIFWYRDYFAKKKKLLEELGALGTAKEIGESVTSLPGDVP